MLLFPAWLLAGCDTDATGTAVVEAEPEPIIRDGIPAAVTVSPDARFTARVQAGGALLLEGPWGTRKVAEVGVIHVLSFSQDGTQLAYAQEQGSPETDLFLLGLESDTTEPRRVTDWVGSEDRPIFSPEADRLAFVSGRTGWASIWVLDLESAAVKQVSNVGVEDQPKVPGQAPAGFVPPPESDFAWGSEGLSWLARGQTWTVAEAELSP